MTYITPNDYRSCLCGELREAHIGRSVRAAGWVDTIRAHKEVQFVDLRDQSGVLQVVLEDPALLRGVTRESVIAVEGPVVRREEDTVNDKIPTGRVELRVRRLTVLGKCAGSLPFEVDASRATREETRLRYRFLDLRNPAMHRNLLFRARVIRWLRDKMEALGFLEVQTPILTASSPEGARDYLIPSRKHRGQFYALPQAPQIFKQLLMVSGVDRYYQIAPCFRDEDARADRSPGEFYQLDFEMAFAGQEDVLRVAEEVVGGLFRAMGGKPVTEGPFPRIPYREAMVTYGSDKPDLRNPLRITELSDLFAHSAFAPFRGRTVRGIAVAGEKLAGKPRSFFQQTEQYARDIGMAGLGYLKVEEGGWQGPIDKFLTPEQREALAERCGLKSGDYLYFIAGEGDVAAKQAGLIRSRLGETLGLLEDAFRFCFVTDFPMFERDELGQLGFTHNPFSMPQGGMAALEGDPEQVLAWQYDLVCNGVELSSGAVRDHEAETLIRGFQLAGYKREEVEARFPALCTALRYGAPPHAGMAPGIERMVMLLLGEENIREVTAFPMNAAGQDLLMGAPSPVPEQSLRELHIECY